MQAPECVLLHFACRPCSQNQRGQGLEFIFIISFSLPFPLRAAANTASSSSRGIHQVLLLPNISRKCISHESDMREGARKGWGRERGRGDDAHGEGTGREQRARE
jgi:hypothetical protein